MAIRMFDGHVLFSCVVGDERAVSELRKVIRGIAHLR